MYTIPLYLLHACTFDGDGGDACGGGSGRCWCCWWRAGGNGGEVPCQQVPRAVLAEAERDALDEREEDVADGDLPHVRPRDRREPPAARAGIRTTHLACGYRVLTGTEQDRD